MSRPAETLITPLPFKLVFSDGEPLESEWHTLQMPYLWHLIWRAMTEQGKSDFYVGGNMFVYYSIEQARDVAEGRPYLRGPDVFWVNGVDFRRIRKGWVVWEEDGRLPDVIVELLSDSTAEVDRRDKVELYSKVWGTREYFLYDPDTKILEGYRLAGQTYRPLTLDAQGRLWSEQLGVSLGLWHGVYEGKTYDWVRLFRPDGSLVPSEAEAERQRADEEYQRAEAERQKADAERLRAEAERLRAETERQKAEAERQRADAAEAEVARLRALLQQRNTP